MVIRSSMGKMLVRDLWASKAQLISIGLVVGIGVAVLFGFSTTHRSLKKSRDAFYQKSEFSRLFARTNKAPASVARDLAKIPGIIKVEPRLEYEALLSVPKMVEPAVGHFISIPDGQQPKMNQLYLKKGRLPTVTGFNEVVVTEGFFNTHGFQLGDEFSATLNGTRKPLNIVGVAVSPEHIFSLQPGSPLPDDKHFTIVWINESVLAASFDMRSSFNSVVFDISRQVPTGRMIADVDRKLENYGGLGAYDRDKQSSYVYLREELKQLQVQALSVPIIFFIVAAFILNIVISRMVRAQRREIATLKAVGYLNRDVSAYYFLFALAILMLGTLFGILIGSLIGHNMIQLYGVYYHLPNLTYDPSLPQLLYAIVGSGITALFGVMSSLKNTFQLEPAEAMRPPAPPSYHNHFLERQNWFQQATVNLKMLTRSLLLYPFKSIMTGMGFSLSVVILISGLFWMDSMDYMMVAQYSFAQKETGRIQLAQSVPIGSVQEILNLPGVVEAEGYRTAPVKVTFENDSQNTSITGLPKNQKLKGLIDQNLQELPAPDTETFVSRNLADQMGFSLGDVIQVEILEGQKPKWNFRVSRIVDSMMSNELFTSRKALADRLNSDDLVNQILFRSYSDESVLYTKLKQMPQVLSVTYRDSALDFFKDNAAKFIGVFAFILSLFAGCIGFGVAYNSLRVTLAERDWELATLRILGFTVPEVFKILTLEILLLFALFLPLGWVLGYYNARWLLEKMSMDAMKIPFVVDSATFFWASMVIVASIVISSGVIYRLVKKADIVEVLKTRN